MQAIILDGHLGWPEIAQIAADGRKLALSAVALARIDAANAIVGAIVEKSVRAYGVNTGVGALSDIVIPREQHALLSRNILFSHAVGIGELLPVAETRAIMTAMVNNWAHGYSGLRRQVVQRMIDLLNTGCTPDVPSKGSVGYISHAAHVSLALIGIGTTRFKGEALSAAEVHARLGLETLVLEAKEGLCLVNGTPCVTGLSCLVLQRASRLMDWSDAIAAMTCETQRCQIAAFDPVSMALRASPGLTSVAAKINHLLAGSEILAASAGRRTQDALSLRAIPQIHGAVRDAFANAAAVVEREVSSVTDNPIVAGTPEAPKIYSQAHAVGASIGLAMDQIAVAFAELGAHSGGRLDRMVNPLISGLPAFLALEGGAASGFMIAQYTAVSLIGENRRLAAPSSLDGGSTSALQEDVLCHATPAALKALQILSNVQNLLAIEFLAAAQSYDLMERRNVSPAPLTLALYRSLRAIVRMYADDRPLGLDIAAAARFIDQHSPCEIFTRLGLS